jgi:molybdopterin molybdotransferase
VTFLLLVRPALLKMRGIRELDLPFEKATAEEAFENRGDRRHFLRAILERGCVRSAGRQGSHVLSSLAAANCLVDLSAGASVCAGTQVRVLGFDP